MEFVKNYPIVSVLMALFASINLYLIISVFVGVWKEELRANVKELKEEIEKYDIHLKRWIYLYLKLKLKSESEKSNSRHMIVRINQGIEIERLKDELKEANEPTEQIKYVEDMTMDYLKCIQEKNELKLAFNQASTELNRLQGAERENKELRAKVSKAIKENDQLKEQVKRLHETIAHKKHGKKEQKETGYWLCVVNAYNCFVKGEFYQGYIKDQCLYIADNKGVNCIVNRAFFKPAENPTATIQGLDIEKLSKTFENITR